MEPNNQFTIHNGDNLPLLKQLADDSIDAIVTDPPYGLSFMGKKWDYDVPSEDVWRECLRVLKPGGHLLAFAGTRTQHRMAVRIEDAGFEIRDMIAWVYGSGFPKSLDVSKAIDKVNGNADAAIRFCRWFRTTGVTRRQATEAMVTDGHITQNGTMASHYFATSPSRQPAMPTTAIWKTLRPLCGDVPAWVDELVQRIEAEREVVGRKEMRDTVEIRIAVAASAAGHDSQAKRLVNITAPATDAARQWDGWGTALKPALEPITLARKPISGTVAANVLKHGTGALNVDGCKVRTNDVLAFGSRELGDGIKYRKCKPTTEGVQHSAGRWPANLIHDGSDEVVGLFPLQPSGKNDGKMVSAARFFYCAKASRAEREAGLEEIAARDTYGVAGQWGSHDCFSGKSGDPAWRAKHPNNPARNVHPTVKPTALMGYLCRLVTPLGGIVLDPFMGSGSTGCAAILEGFRFIGMEREPEYVAIAQARIEHAIKRAIEQDNASMCNSSQLSLLETPDES